MKLPVSTDVKQRSDAGFFRLPGAALAPRLAGIVSSGGVSRFPEGGSSARPFYYPILLAILFVIAFALPVVVAARMGGMLGAGSIPDKSVDELFPDSISVGTGDLHLSVGSSPLLEPEANRDLLIVSWVKFRRLPMKGERVVLFSKSEPASRSKTGYALGVSGEDGELRPMVFWGDPDGGRWYKFTETKIPSREWIMFAVSLREGKYLGLHVAEVTGPGKSDLRLLGGYELEKTEFVGNTLPLVLAPPGPMRLIGKVGPIGVYKKKELTEDLHELLKKLSRSPLAGMEPFSRREVKLWWPGGTKDLGPNALPVQVVGSLKTRKGATN